VESMLTSAMASFGNHCRTANLRFSGERMRVVAALLAPLVTAKALASAADLISFAEAAQRAGLARKTLYEWKRTGKLRREHGLRAAGRSVRIEWGVFKASIDDGGLS
jgi:hypothetical protein